MKKNSIFIAALLSFPLVAAPLAFAEDAKYFFRFPKSAGEVKPLNGIEFNPGVIYVGDSVLRLATLKNSGNGTIIWNASGPLPNGLAFSSNGSLQGVATQSGDFGPLTISATDTLNQTTSFDDFSISVFALPTANDIVRNTAIHQPLTIPLQVSGGGGGLVASIKSGHLPDGMNLSGLNITGTPTRADSFHADVEFTDKNGKTTSSNVDITVFNDLHISSSFPDAYVNSSYTGGFNASGGSGAFVWSLNSAIIPGLTFNTSSGMFTGIPSESGSYPVIATLFDHPQRQTASETLSIFDQPMLSNKSYPDVYKGTAYSEASPALSGGKLPFTWSASNLPSGFSINAITGIISSSASASSGMPANIVNNFTINAHDINGISASNYYSVTARDVLAVSSANPSNAVPNVAYNYAFGATGGKPPYSWSISTGSPPPGLVLASSGGLTGTPSAVGKYDFTVRVVDANNKSASSIVAMKTVATLDIANVATTDGYVNEPYPVFSFLHTGGLPDYTWSIASGSLPNGLTLATNGTMSGTPQVAGKSDYTIRVTDSEGTTASKSSSITIYSPLLITSSTLPESYIQTEFDGQLTNTGGKAPFTWTIASGTLPAGMSLSTDGKISGTPTVSGAYNATVKVVDANNRSASKAINGNILPALAIAAVTIPDVYVNSAMSSVQLNASGGKSPYQWSVSSGSLPAGVSLSTAGVLSGTPTATGTYSFTIAATDLNNVKTTRALTMVSYAPPVVANAPSSDGYIGTSFSHTFSVTGGKSAYTWRISSGSLPTGLTLNASTGALSGTPSSSGTFSYTVEVKDANARVATRAVTQTIYNVMAITNAPAAYGYVGTAFSHTFQVSGGKSAYSWSATGLPAGISLSTSGVLSGTPTTAATYNATITVKDANNKTATRSVSVVIYGQLAISSTLPTAMQTRQTTAYAATATGGKTPYTYTASNLPAGISINASTGALTGTRTTLQTVNTTITAKDANGLSVALSRQVVVSAGTISATMSAGNGSVTLQQFFNAADWADVNVNKSITLPSGSIRGSTIAGSTVVSIGSAAWGGALTFTVNGEIQGASGAAGAKGGNAFHANILGKSNQKLSLIVNGAIRAGGGGGGAGGKGGTGGGGVYVQTTEVREPATGDYYNFTTVPMNYFSHMNNNAGYEVAWNYTFYPTSGISLGGLNSVPTSVVSGSYTYHRGSFRENAIGLSGIPAAYYGVYRTYKTSKNVNSNGGAGGNGSAGGRGQGYNAALTGGTAGVAGVVGGTNAGRGGTGGTGGAGGGWGATGKTGATGATGANGNRTNGAAGLAGSLGAAAGYGILTPGNVNRSGSGAVQGL